MIDKLIERLVESPFLAIVGPSGIGKSSVVRAGLIPALRNGRISGSDQWLITDMLPGAHPFLELKRAIERVAINRPIGVTEALAAREPTALGGLAAALPDRSPLLILIDQFEELFTMTSADERESFLQLLNSTVETGEVIFVITLRADFLDQPLRYSEFGELLSASMVPLHAPTVGELAQAIARPAAGVGVTIDHSVIERMAREVHDQAGALPLLQYALTELFAARTSDFIDETDYDALGGIEGSLARRAETIYGVLDNRQKDAIRQVFLRAVAITDDGPPARRRMPVANLRHLEADEPIEAFTAARMLVQDNDRETHLPTVEVAHEALLTQWPRLVEWIEAAREELLLARRLDEAAGEWLAKGRDSAYLLSGGRLAQHKAWTTAADLTLTVREQEYLDTSIEYDARRQSRSERRRRLVLGAFASVAAFAALFSVVALRNSSLATRSQVEAEAEALASSATVALESDPTLSLLLGLEAFQRSPSLAATSAVHQGLQADRQVMAIPPPDGSTGAAASIDPDGSRVAIVGYRTSTVQLWEIGANEPSWEAVLTEESSAILPPFSHFWFSRDGARIYIPLTSADLPETGAGVGIYTIDAATGETLSYWPFPCLLRLTPAGGQYVIDGAPFAADWDEPTATGCSAEKTFSGVVDIAEKTIIYETDFGGFTPPTLSGDSKRLATTGWVPIDDGDAIATSRVFDTVADEMVLEVPGYPATVSSDGTRVLAGTNPASLYDLESGNRLASYQGDFSRIGFVSGDARVTASGPSGVIGVFDAMSGREVLTLRGHTGQVRMTATNLDGRVMVSSGFDGARVWDVGSITRGDLSSITLDSPTDDRFYPDALSASGGLLLARRGRTSSPIPFTEPHRIDVIDLEDEQLRWTTRAMGAELGPHGLAVIQPILEDGRSSPSGSSPATLVGPPRLVDAETGDLVRELGGCEFYWANGQAPEPATGCSGAAAFDLPYFRFSDDGSRVVGSNQLGAIVVWDVVSGEVVFERPAVQQGVNMLFNQGTRWATSLSPDGQWIVVPPSAGELQGRDGAADPQIRVIDIETGDEVAGFDTQLWTNFTAFEPTGNLLTSGENLQVFDLETGEGSALTLPQGARIEALALSPEGNLAATVAVDGSVAVWDLERRVLVTIIPLLGDFGEAPRGVTFRDNETVLVAPDIGNEILQFTLDPTKLLDVASDRLTRGFRPEECATYELDPCPKLGDLAGSSS